MNDKINRAFIKGWHSAGDETRELIVECDVNPDKFLAVEGAKELIARYTLGQISKQQLQTSIRQLGRKTPDIRI